MGIKTEKFIEKSLIIHDSFYSYDKTRYVKCIEKVIITCPIHGDFKQIPNNHLRGSGCLKCKCEKAKTKPTEFINKSREVHNDKYDYHKVNYIDSSTKVEITCKQHGEFKQAPKEHLYGQGCPICANIRPTRTLTHFIEKAQKIHEDKYDYSLVDYINSVSKIEINCKIHGSFKQTPVSHLQGHGCVKCGAGRTTEEFIQKSKEKHGETYDYTNTIYTHSDDKVSIICKKHGEFEQVAKKHSEGHGCKKCGFENSKGFYSRSEYIKMAKNRKCICYILKCFDKEEIFYKIGITSHSIKKRYNTTNTMPYNYEIISEIYGEAGFIWDLESEEKRKLKEFNYQPNTPFKGSKTECFTQYDIDATTK